MTPIKTLWQKLGGRGLMLSLGLHLVLILVAGFWVITELTAPKEKVFTAATASADTAAKQVEHRVQLARRAGSSGGAALSAQRITGATVSTFSMPDMPESSSVGLGAPAGGGFGAGGFGLGSGSGSGFGRGTGGTAGSVRDVMSIFGAVRINGTNDRVVFLIDVSDHMMTPQKGGFEAYAIVRAEMEKLVTRLPLAVRFNAIVFDNGSVNLFRPDLQAATAATKEAFVAWFDPINRDASRRGAGGNNWRRKNEQTEIKVGTEDRAAHAITAAFEMQPSAVYLFTGRLPVMNVQRLTPEELERERKRAGDTAEVQQARSAAYGKARRELDALNQQLRSQGKSPIIIPDIWTLENPANQRAFRAAGVEPIKFDRTGWTNARGDLIRGVIGHRRMTADEILDRLREVQKIIGGERPKLSVTLLLGPEDPQEADQEALGRVARGFSGRVSTIDFKELQSIQRRSD